MSVDILTTRDSDQWWEYFHKLPESYQHIHFSPAYHKLLEANGDGQARLFIYIEEDNFLFYPFMLRSIDQIGDRKLENDYHDVSSVFGYTGPLVFSKVDKFVNNCHKHLMHYFKEKDVIAELIRFNPILKNDRLNLWEGLEKVPIKEYTYLKFPEKSDNLYNIYSSRLQTYLNKAEKMGIKVMTSRSKKDVYDFFDLYCQHMRRINVDKYYLFSDKYFEELYDFIQKYGYLIFSRVEGELAAGLVFLEYQQAAYYHHGARNIHVDNSSLINKYLFHKAFVRQIESGLSSCLLGGGATNDDDDSLLQFKKFFTNKSSDFVIGRRVINHAKYQKVVDVWKEECPDADQKYKSFVDKYRFC